MNAADELIPLIGSAKNALNEFNRYNGMSFILDDRFRKLMSGARAFEGRTQLPEGRLPEEVAGLRDGRSLFGLRDKSPPPAHRVHSVCTPCTPCVHCTRLQADPHLRFASRACRRARQVSLGHKCVLQAIGYQEIKERFTFEQRVASYGLVKLTTWDDEGRTAAAAGFVYFSVWTSFSFKVVVNVRNAIFSSARADLQRQ